MADSICLHCGKWVHDLDSTTCRECEESGHTATPFAGCLICAQRDESAKESAGLRASVCTVLRDMALLSMLILSFSCAVGWCAPTPKPKLIDDPERAVENLLRSFSAKDKVRVVGGLDKLLNHTIQQGKYDEAERIREYLAVLSSVHAEKPWSATQPVTQVLASARAKYRCLRYVIYAPGDITTYGNFNDFGHWPGTSYLGHTELTVCYWVYVYPRWYAWRDCISPTAR